MFDTIYIYIYIGIAILIQYIIPVNLTDVKWILTDKYIILTSY